jgi:hypothetical protein
LRGAFDHLAAGDRETHDRPLAQKLAQLDADADVIVLARASMARAVEGMPTRPKVPVLTRLELDVLRLKALLAQASASNRGAGKTARGLRSVRQNHAVANYGDR